MPSVHLTQVWFPIPQDPLNTIQYDPAGPSTTRMIYISLVLLGPSSNTSFALKALSWWVENRWWGICTPWTLLGNCPSTKIKRERNASIFRLTYITQPNTFWYLTYITQPNAFWLNMNWTGGGHGKGRKLEGARQILNGLTHKDAYTHEAMYRYKAGEMWPTKENMPSDSDHRTQGVKENWKSLGNCGRGIAAFWLWWDMITLYS